MFEQEQIDHLSAKLDRQHVKSRQQAGRSLSYIEGWHAIAEANRIFGFSEWDRTLCALKTLGEPREVDGKWRVAYMATVRITVRSAEEETTRDGTGYGSGIDRDLGSAHESAIKEAETDAMKRALMTFGNPFGLALYDKTQENVETNSSSAPSGRNATPAVPRTSSGTVAPLSQLGETYRSVMLLAKTKDDLGAWMADNTEELKRKLGEDEASVIRTLAAARYRELPEARQEAAE